MKECEGNIRWRMKFPDWAVSRASSEVQTCNVLHFPKMGKRKTTEESWYMPSREIITTVGILGRLCQIVVSAWPVKSSRACLNLKVFLCTLCARSLKYMYQELSYNDNTYHFFQPEVSRTVTSNSANYSGLFRGQHYCYIGLLRHMNLTVWVYLYTCAVCIFLNLTIC